MPGGDPQPATPDPVEPIGVARPIGMARPIGIGRSVNAWR
jgi:hypothetical protein